MSISVTGNVSSVTDVIVLLSSLGFDTGSSDTVSEVVIDNFDHWTDGSRQRGYYASSTGCGLQLAA